MEAKACTRADFTRVVASVYKNDNTSGYHSNMELRSTYQMLVDSGDIEINENLEKLLITKKMRSLSGVSVITVLTKPYPCPGNCIYCPTVKNVPKSYLPDEPAVMRAILNDYDPKKQVETRMESLVGQGHPVEKVELIIIGGTFSHLPKSYQEEFVKSCFDALNGSVSKNLVEAKKLNELSISRCVGLTLETRPDHITKEEVKWFRYLGATRVELGVQTIYNNILQLNNRGEKIEDTVRATKLLKDAGFKICYHLMPNLYGSDLKKDKQMFVEIFNNSDFCPDYIKIYPCMVINGTELYKLWQEGQYTSYTDEELSELICDIKREVPYWIRIMRTIRDIPAGNIESGSKVSNMRQNILKQAEDEGWKCHCIRCREIGAGPGSDPQQPRSAGGRVGPFETKNGESLKGSHLAAQGTTLAQGGYDIVMLFIEKYRASDGVEYFLSFEDEKRENLYSLLRLRLTNNQTIDAIRNCAIIREVHTYGKEVEIGKRGDNQHKGYGRRLIEEAEKIAKSNEYKQIAVISGVGARDYYRKFGYELVGEYMVKELT